MKKERSSGGGKRSEGSEAEKWDKGRKSVGAKNLEMESVTNLRHSGEFHDSFILPFRTTVPYGGLVIPLIERAFRKPCDSTDGTTETPFHSGSDDPREPLALDNTPKPPIVIEEISNVEEEEAETSSLYRIETDFSKQVDPFPSNKRSYHSDDLSGKEKMLFPVSSSASILVYGAKRSVNSSTFPDIIVVGHVAEGEGQDEEEEEEEGEGEEGKDGGNM